MTKEEQTKERRTATKTNSLCYQLFGKKLEDLSPDEHKEYQHIKDQRRREKRNPDQQKQHRNYLRQKQQESRARKRVTPGQTSMELQ